MEKPTKASKESRRLPRLVEFEIAKLLNTLGFAAYGIPLWNLAAGEGALGEPIAPHDPVDPVVLGHILGQAAHDPSILSPGARAVPFLKQTRRTLAEYWGVDAPSLFVGLQEPPSLLIAVSRVDERLVPLFSQLQEAFGSANLTSSLLIVTEQSGRQASHEMLKQLPTTRLLFWLDHCSGPSSTSSRVFALFIHVVGAPNVLIFDSALANSTLSRYGRALTPYQGFFIALCEDEETPTARTCHTIRIAGKFSTILTRSEEQLAQLVRLIPMDPDRIKCFGNASAVGNEFSQHLEMKSPPVGRPLIDNLLSGSPDRLTSSDRSAPPSPSTSYAVDITVAIVFHQEASLAVPALASLEQLVRVARNEGLQIEAIAMLDKADEATCSLVAKHGSFLDEIHSVAFGDLGLTRNAVAIRAKGRFLSCLDGDDLWSSNWLSAAFRAAVKADHTAIWHPSHLYDFFPSDSEFAPNGDVPHPSVQSRHVLHRGCDEADFDARELLLESLWSANAFALTEIFRAFPYKQNNWAEQTGIEDWRWNLETLGSGLIHLIVPQTVHLVREKDEGSLGQLSDAVGLLPILSN